MAKNGDIIQYKLDDNTFNNKIIEFDQNIAAKIGLSTREKNYLAIYEDDFAQNNNRELSMIITYADNSSSTIQLGKTFMYESQVAMKIKEITFTNSNFPPGTYLEVRYE